MDKEWLVFYFKFISIYIYIFYTYLLVVGEKTVGEDVVDYVGIC